MGGRALRLAPGPKVAPESSDCKLFDEVSFRVMGNHEESTKDTKDSKCSKGDRPRGFLFARRRGRRRDRRRYAARVAPPGLQFHCLHSGGSRRFAALHSRLIRGRPFGARGAASRLFAASLRSAEFGRAADAAQARASPASLTDGGDAVGTSRASARRTSSPVVGGLPPPRLARRNSVAPLRDAGEGFALPTTRTPSVTHALTQ